MNKELEALERLYDNLKSNDYFFREDASEDYTLIEKSLKTLDIIKEKRVDLLKLDYYGWQLNLYNEDLRNEYNLTQQEYDLLKEVLL